jgi:hypothetical protein
MAAQGHDFKEIISSLSEIVQKKWGHPLKGTCQGKIALRQKTEFFAG